MGLPLAELNTWLGLKKIMGDYEIPVVKVF